MTIFDRIKERRKQLGLSQEQLANRLGLKTRAAISAVEKGKCDMTTDRIRRYADALHTTPAYLMGWSDDPEAPDTQRDEAIEYADEIMGRQSMLDLFRAAHGCADNDLKLATDLLNNLKGR